jgi:hypothetical protein
VQKIAEAIRRVRWNKIVFCESGRVEQTTGIERYSQFRDDSTHQIRFALPFDPVFVTRPTLAAGFWKSFNEIGVLVMRAWNR